MIPPQPPRLYTPQEVAMIFRVDAKTVTRWARTGKLPAATMTPGGHRRYNADEIDRIYKAGAGS